MLLSGALGWLKRNVRLGVTTPNEAELERMRAGTVVNSPYAPQLQRDAREKQKEVNDGIGG